MDDQRSLEIFESFKEKECKQGGGKKFRGSQKEKNTSNRRKSQDDK